MSFQLCVSTCGDADDVCARETPAVRVEGAKPRAGETFSFTYSEQNVYEHRENQAA